MFTHLVGYDFYCLMLMDEKPVLPRGLPEQELALLGAGGVAMEHGGSKITRYSDASCIPASEDVETALLLGRGRMCKSFHMNVDKASIADLKGFVGRLTEIEGKSQAQEASPALERLAADAKDDDTDDEGDADEVHVDVFGKDVEAIFNEEAAAVPSHASRIKASIATETIRERVRIAAELSVE